MDSFLMKSEQSQWTARLDEQLSSRESRLLNALLSRRVILVAIDLALAMAAYLTAWALRLSVELPFTQALLPQERWEAVSHPWLLLVATQFFFLFIFGLYDDLRSTRFREIVAFTFMACLLQMVTVSSLFYFTNQIFPRTVILLYDSLNFLLLTLWRFHVKARFSSQILKVLIVGERADSMREITREIENSPWMGLRIAGVAVKKVEESAETLRYPLLGTLDELEEIIARHQIDEILFVSSRSWKDQVLHALSRMQSEYPLRIAILPSAYEIIIGRLRHVNIHDTPLIEVRRNPNEPFERFIKRSFDLFFSVCFLLLLMPMFLLIGLAIKLTSPGPVFYSQERVGLGGRHFRLLKFRTMIHDAERDSGVVLASPNDPRVTSAGRFLRRFRLDELPQLLNVLKGDMSFAGPRPERPTLAREFERRLEGYGERHKVKPGITGLAQVRGFYHTTAENKLRYDLAYIYNYSFSLDLLIFLETIKVVLIRRGS